MTRGPGISKSSLELAAEFARRPGSHDDAWLRGEPMDPLAETPEPLQPLAGFPFVIPAAAAIVSGPTGGGRSALVQACSYDAARAGLRVAYLGSEITPAEFNARAADLAERRGDTLDEPLQQQLASVRYLDLASTLASAWAHPGRWASIAPGLFDVVLIDPLSSVASSLDLDFDGSNADFVKFYDTLVQPLVTRNVAIVMLENIGHAFDTKARPKGVSAKLDRADLAFSCKLQSQPVGLSITATKVRSVRAPFARGAKWVFVRDSQRVERLADDGAAGTFRPTTLMERASRVIEAKPGISKGDLRNGIQARAKDVDVAVDRLLEEEFVRREVGLRKHSFFSEKPYRAEDDPHAAIVTDDEALLDRADQYEAERTAA